MAQSSSGLCFLYESSQAIFIADELPRKQLERDFAFELGIFGQIDFTHPAGAETREEAVMGDRRVGWQ